MTTQRVDVDSLERWSSLLLEGRYRCARVFRETSPERFLSREELRKRADQLNDAVHSTLQLVLRDVWENEGRYYFWPGYSVSYGARLDEVEPIPDTNPNNLEPWRRPAHPAAYGTDLTSGDQFRFSPLSVWMELFYGRLVDRLRLRGFTQYVKSLRARNPGPLTDVHARHIHCIEITTVSGESSFDVGVARFGLAESASPAQLLRLVRENLANTFGEVQRFPPVYCENGHPVPPKEAEQLRPVFEELFWSIFNGFSNGDTARLQALAQRMEGSGAVETARRIVAAVRLLERLDDREQAIAFPYYYVFPLESALGPSARLAPSASSHTQSLDLGTINLYTTKPLPAAFVLVLKPWLQAMYAQLRLLETFDQTVTLAVELERTSQAHELKELVETLESRPRTEAELRALATAFRTLLGVAPLGFTASRTLSDLITSAVDIVTTVRTAIGDVSSAWKIRVSDVPSVSLQATHNTQGWYVYGLAIVSAIRNALKHTTSDIDVIVSPDIILLSNTGDPPSTLAGNAKRHPGSSAEAVLYFLSLAQVCFALPLAPEYGVSYDETTGRWETRLQLPPLSGDAL